mgnify:CR=1 FL=1
MSLLAGLWRRILTPFLRSDSFKDKVNKRLKKLGLDEVRSNETPRYLARTKLVRAEASEKSLSLFVKGLIALGLAVAAWYFSVGSDSLFQKFLGLDPTQMESLLPLHSLVTILILPFFLIYIINDSVRSSQAADVMVDFVVNDLRANESQPN